MDKYVKVGNVHWSTLLQLGFYQFFVCLQANIGQEEDFDAARKKAENLGAKKVIRKSEN